MTPHRIGFLYWPGTKALTLSLAEEALRVAQRVHPEVVYELVFLQAEPLAAGDWRLPGEPGPGIWKGWTSCSCWPMRHRRRYPPAWPLRSSSRCAAAA